MARGDSFVEYLVGPQNSRYQRKVGDNKNKKNRWNYREHNLQNYRVRIPGDG